MTGNNIKYYNELLEEDLTFISEQTKDILENFKYKTIFITGGTGFFGKWFLETFAYMNSKLNLNCNVIILSRNPEKFLKDYYYFGNNKQFKFIKGDVRNFEYPEEKIDFIIHAATEASEKLNNENPLLMFDTIIEGTRYVLDLAKEKKVKSFLFTSSGAVYGKQPSEMTHISEDYNGAPDCLNPKSAYGEGKRAAEMLCTLYFNQYSVPVKIARCFAFVGPYLPLNAHFAIGNFILNTLNGQNIIIKGDGTPYRSYLYAADLITWLLTILLKGENNKAYNVGSDRDITIKELAEKIQSFNTKIKVRVLKEAYNKVNVERYVPSISLIKDELSLNISYNLVKSIKRTINYYFNIKTL